jgi:multiple sugar transport system substrate-binding protein
MKNLFFWGLSVLISLAFVLAACVPVTAIPQDAPTLAPVTATIAPTATLTPTPAPRITLDSALLRGEQILLAHALFGYPAESLQKLATRFNAENEWGISVSLRRYDNYLALEEALLDPRHPASLALVLPEQAARLRYNSLSVDLSSYIGDPGWGWSQAERADFLPALQPLSGQSIPAFRATRLIFYNETWAKSLGFSRPPATVDEFRQQACAANAFFKQDADLTNDGFGGLLLDAEPATMLAWLYAFGGGPGNVDAYLFDTVANRQSFAFVRDLYDRNCAWFSNDAPPYYNAFLQRRALFIVGNLNEVGDLIAAATAANVSDTWTVLPFPAASDQLPLVLLSGPNFVLRPHEPQTQLAAWIFMQWALSPENQATLARETGLLPARASAYDLLDSFRTAAPRWSAAANYARDFGRDEPERLGWGAVRRLPADAFRHMLRMGLPATQIQALLQQMDATARDLNK